MLKTLAYIVLAWVALAAVGGLAPAAQVVQQTPNIPIGAEHVYLNFYLVNDNPGAVYNSATLHAAWLGTLAQDTWQLPVNTYNFDSPQHMMQEWTLTILPKPSGNVYNGWQAAIEKTPGSQNTGAVTLTHAPFGYDLWTAAAGQNTMALTLRIPLAQLERDGQTGYHPNKDANITIANNTISNAFVGVYNINNMWPAPACQYQLAWEQPDCTDVNIADTGHVGIQDLAAFAEMWLMQGLFLKEDINKDGIVDLHDFLHIARWWERTCE
jgi:hypothetical protein